MKTQNLVDFIPVLRWNGLPGGYYEYKCPYCGFQYGTYLDKLTGLIHLLRHEALGHKVVKVYYANSAAGKPHKRGVPPS